MLNSFYMICFTLSPFGYFYQLDFLFLVYSFIWVISILRKSVSSLAQKLEIFLPKCVSFSDCYNYICHAEIFKIYIIKLPFMIIFSNGFFFQVRKILSLHTHINFPMILSGLFMHFFLFKYLIYLLYPSV